MGDRLRGGAIVDARMKPTGDGLAVAAIADEPKVAFLVIGP